jgi:phage terminase small subunit
VSVEEGAVLLREELGGGPLASLAQAESHLLAAARSVAARRRDVVAQQRALSAHARAYFKDIIEAAQARMDELAETLEREAERKDGVLAAQVGGSTPVGGSLQGRGIGIVASAGLYTWR